MEAVDESKHRMKVKFRKAAEPWVSAPPSVTPDIQSWFCGSGDGSVETLRELTQGELHGSAFAVGGEKETTTLRSLQVEKSDHLIVVMKPGNAGGAKGVTE